MADQAGAQNDVILALEELLAAERAGARVAAQTSQQISGEDAKQLMIVVQRDEARWCAMLIAQLRRLGATPSTDVGAFYEKAMAIEDHDARLSFLNKGQDWVVRRLERLMPRVQDDAALHADLAEMHRAHVVNIEATEQLLTTRRGATH